jgi:hypothetical protein
MAFSRIAGRFGRVEPRRRARSFLLGLLSDVDTRSCWQLAEQAGRRRCPVAVRGGGGWLVGTRAGPVGDDRLCTTNIAI